MADAVAAKATGKEFLGNEYLLFIKSSGSASLQAVACLKSNSLSIKADSIDTTSKCGGSWKSTRAGQRSWTMQAEGNAIDTTGLTNVASLDVLKNLAKTGEVFEAQMVQLNTTVAGNVDRGMVSITDFSISGENNGLKTFSMTLEGQGELFSAAS